jgi:hypothetical protein
MSFLLSLQALSSLRVLRLSFRLKLNIHGLLIACVKRAAHKRRSPIIERLYIWSGILWKFKSEYFDEILEDIANGIMQIPNLPDNIFSTFLGNCLIDPNIHIAVDELIGIDVSIVIHLLILNIHHVLCT